MALSSIVTYTDPAAMEAAHVAARTEILPIGREKLVVRATRVELPNLWLTRVYESSSRLKHISLDPRRSFITFATGPGPEIIVRGTPMPPTSLMRHCKGHSYYERTTGAANWGTVSMPEDTLPETGHAMAGIDLRSPGTPSLVAVAPDALGRFQRLHGAIAALAAEAPQVIASPQAAHAMEQSLIEALVESFRKGDAKDPGWAQQCHATVMRRFHRELDANPDRAVYVPEICAAIGVPERTLRLCCQHQLGMSPKHYLTVRRMHLAHRCLLMTGPNETTVTEVAMRFGFWHLSRFAAEHRLLFGESPSATLHLSRAIAANPEAAMRRAITSGT